MHYCFHSGKHVTIILNFVENYCKKTDPELKLKQFLHELTETESEKKTETGKEGSKVYWN